MLEHSKRQMNMKKIRRKENKKKKLGALLEICKLNDEDRKKSLQRTSSLKSEETSEEKQSGEPKPKRLRTDCKLPLNGEKLCPQDVTSEKTVSANGKSSNSIKWSRYRRKKERPRLELSDVGQRADLNVPSHHRVPISMADIQHFLVYSVLGNLSAKGFTRWIQLKKIEKLEKRIFMVIEGAGVNEFLENAAELNVLTQFEHQLEVFKPLGFNNSLVDGLSRVCYTESQKKFSADTNFLKIAFEKGAEFCTFRAMFPFHQKSSQTSYSQGNKVCGLKITAEENNRNFHSFKSSQIQDNFNRTLLLLSEWQMLEESYPLPWPGQIGECYKDYLFTHDAYEEVTGSSPMWSLDCEMCMTRLGQELTRICIINEDHEIVYETLVKPYNPIINYLTQYSGITEKLLANVHTRLEEVQRTIRALCPPDLILIGQSLNSDLKALRMMHPFVIDTSVIFNLSGQKTKKTKLRVLAEEFLSERIQGGSKGHCPIEDALACMKLVQAKLQHSLSWGNAILCDSSDDVELKGKSAVEVKEKVFPLDETKSLKQVNWPELLKRRSNSCQDDGRGSRPDRVQDLRKASLFSHLVRRDKSGNKARDRHI